MPLAVAFGQAGLAGPAGESRDFAAATTPGGALLAVKGVALALADGVGKGRGGGDLAEAAVRGLLDGWYSSPETWGPSRCLRALFEDRNRAARGEHRGEACTLTAVVIVGRSAHVAHAGDSRAWLVRGGTVRLLTVDHVWEHPDLRSVLSRAIGLDEAICPHLAEIEVAEGDLLVLASDGFHKECRLEDALAGAEDAGDPEWLAERCARLAKERGSSDDITVAVLRIDALPAPGEMRMHSEGAELAPVEELREGAEFDGFRLSKRLAASRASEIWLADDRESEQRLVLKIPKAASSIDPGRRAEFLREEWIGRRIADPGVVKVLALRPGRRTRLYYAMPWTPGISLRRILEKGGPVDAFFATAMALETARAVEALHRQGVLHRDIKPDNILRLDAGRFLLTDLGIAKAESIEDGGGSEPGTPSYMAPELFDGAPASEATEIYALGVTLYECLTLRHPYGEIEPFVRPRFGRPVPPSRWNPHIPHWLETIVLKAVAADPQHRFQALSEMLVLLERRERVQEAIAPGKADAEFRNRIWTAVALLAVAIALLEAIALLAG